MIEISVGIMLNIQYCIFLSKMKNNKKKYYKNIKTFIIIFTRRQYFLDALDYSLTFHHEFYCLQL